MVECMGSKGTDKRPQIKSAADVAKLLRSEMSSLEQEHYRVVLLNTKNRVLAMPTVYIGTTNECLIRVAELFREAVRANAVSMILVHNHPSGDPEPSPLDVRITGQIVRAGRLLGVDVLDHVIIGEHGCASMKRRGLGFAVTDPLTRPDALGPTTVALQERRASPDDHAAIREGRVADQTTLNAWVEATVALARESEDLRQDLHDGICNIVWDVKEGPTKTALDRAVEAIEEMMPPPKPGQCLTCAGEIDEQALLCTMCAAEYGISPSEWPEWVKKLGRRRGLDI